MVDNSESIGQHPLGIKERSSHDLMTKEEREALEQLKELPENSA